MKKITAITMMVSGIPGLILLSLIPTPIFSYFSLNLQDFKLKLLVELQREMKKLQIDCNKWLQLGAIINGPN